jgi:hypothetical protein
MKMREYNPYHVTSAPKAIPRQESQKCFQKLQHRWAKYIAAEGEYCDGDPLQ